MEKEISHHKDIRKIMQKLQKPIIFTLFFLTIALFAYSLIFMTPFYQLYKIDGQFLNAGLKNYGLVIGDYADEALYKRNSTVLGLNMAYFTNFTRQAGGLQDFNHLLFSLGFFGIIIGLCLFLFNGQKRKIYYLSNYITIGASSAYSIGVGSYVLFTLIGWQQYMATNVDYKTINAFKSYQDLVTDSSGNPLVKEYFKTSSFNYMFIIGYIISALMIIAGICAICYIVYKIMDQKKHPGLDLSGVNIDE